MSDLVLSYETSRDNKLSFANWISQLSPTETPFVSATGKHPVEQTKFQWQTDTLYTPSENAWGQSDIPDPTHHITTENDNYTQILRKVVQVSDTAEAIDSYGRGSEIEYQFKKAALEMKRDLELILLSDQDKKDGNGDGVRLTSAFYKQVANVNEADPDTGAVVHKHLDSEFITEADIFDMTYNLYMAGSRANTIMFHPKHAKTFSRLLSGKAIGRKKMFSGNSTDLDLNITTIRDPLGQVYDLVPNQWMDEYFIYFFHPHDWFQRILRPPVKHELDVDGDYKKWMLEMEVGLQHRNKFASGIIDLTFIPVNYTLTADISTKSVWYKTTTPIKASYRLIGGSPTKVTWTSSDTSIATIDDSGNVTIKNPGSVTFTVTCEVKKQPAVTATVDLELIPTTVAIDTSYLSQAVPLSGSFQIVTNDFMEITPQEAANMGVSYRSLDNNFVTVDSNGLVKGVGQTQVGQIGRIVVTPLVDPSQAVTIEFTVVIVKHDFTITVPTPPIFATKDYSIAIELTQPNQTKVSITSDVPDTSVTVGSPVKVDDTHYTITLKPLVSGTFNFMITAEYIDGNTSKAFTIKPIDYELNWTPGLEPEDGVVGGSMTVNVRTNDTPNDAGRKPIWDTTDHTVATVTTNAPHVLKFLKEGSTDISATLAFNADKIVVRSKTINVRNPVFRWLNEPEDGIANTTSVEALSVQCTEYDVSKATVVFTSGNTSVAQITSDNKIHYVSASFDAVPITATITLEEGVELVLTKDIKVSNIQVTPNIPNVTVTMTTPLVIKNLYKITPIAYQNEPVEVSYTDANGSNNGALLIDNANGIIGCIKMGDYSPVGITIRLKNYPALSTTMTIKPFANYNTQIVRKDASYSNIITSNVATGRGDVFLEVTGTPAVAGATIAKTVWRLDSKRIGNLVDEDTTHQILITDAGRKTTNEGGIEIEEPMGPSDYPTTGTVTCQVTWSNGVTAITTYDVVVTYQ